MSKTIVVDLKLETITCCACGMAFAFPTKIVAERRRDHETFYCPAGHPQWFPGESKEEGLARELKETQRKLSNARIEEARAWEAAEEQRQQAIAERQAHGRTKASLTRTRKRIAAGVCPVPGCTRSFPDDKLQRHLRSKHPDYVTTEA